MEEIAEDVTSDSGKSLRMEHIMIIILLPCTDAILQNFSLAAVGYWG